MTERRARSEPRSERAQERKGALRQLGPWLKARVSQAKYASPLKFAGLLKAEAHCPRPDLSACPHRQKGLLLGCFAL
jgi:hypothetical protein